MNFLEKDHFAPLHIMPLWLNTALMRQKDKSIIRPLPKDGEAGFTGWFTLMCRASSCPHVQLDTLCKNGQLILDMHAF